MASYEELEPNKKGLPGIKITVEHGYDEETGERLRSFKTVRMKRLSDRAIKKAITDFEIEVANRENTKKVEKITFRQFVDRWMDIYVRPSLSIKTRDAYDCYLRNGVLGYFSDMQLPRIRAFHVEEFFSQQKKNGQKSLGGKYLVLKSIFSKAVKWEVIDNNPMDGVDAPEDKPRHREIQFYDADQLKQLIKTLDKVNPKRRIQIKLAALAGLRRAEIAGIRHESLNFKNNTILIDKTLQYDKEKKEFIMASTKTKKEREVYVPETLMNEIKEYAKEHKKLRLKCGSAWGPLLDEQGEPTNLLFTNKIGFPNHVESISREWGKIVKRYDLPELNFHGLRHTCASYMISKNINFKIIQEQLGHADIKETINRYSHLTKKDKADAVGVFEEIL